MLAKDFCEQNNLDWYAIRNCGQIFIDPPDMSYDQLWHYFDMDTNYNEIKKELAEFNVLHESIKAGGGIRILHQPFIPCVISFIISANNNIKRFTKTIEQIDFDNLEKYTQDDFTRMGCGYRAPYLVQSIQKLRDMDTQYLSNLNNNELRKALMTLPGVGPKVANCVMLFAFHRLDVAPVDTWINKAIDQLGSSAVVIMNHPYAGVAQQYIFYYLQHLHKTLHIA